MTKKILVSAVSIAVLSVLASPAMAQTNSKHLKTRSGVRTTLRMPDDPAIPAMSGLTTETGAREFAESFLVSMTREKGTAIYDSYLHPAFQAGVSRDVFGGRMDEIREILGPVEKLGVVYLRQDNADESRPERGYADYAVAFAMDPRVAVRVDFERAPDGHWKITSYNVTSAAMDRYFRARSAAMAAGDDDNDDDGTDEGAEGDPQSPPRR